MKLGGRFAFRAGLSAISATQDAAAIPNGKQDGLAAFSPER